MKDDTKDTVILSGVSKPLTANQAYTSCITIKNDAGGDVEILALSFRYKSGLSDVLIKIESPNQKSDPILVGECALGGIGSTYENPGFARFHLPGKKPLLSKGQNLVVEVRTFATPVGARDINLLVDAQFITK